MQLDSFEDVTTTHRHIFLSPHFDDAVYSCGGTLAVQVSCGLSPLVITVFGGVPPAGLQLSSLATQIGRQMGILDAHALVETRRKEDASAMNYLRADYLWLNYLDAIYRGTPPYYTQQSELIGGNVHAADVDIDKQLVQDLLQLQQRLPDAVWYVPLAVGRHVDHQIVASAGDRLIQRGANVKLYEDIPYVLKEKALQERMDGLGGTLEPAYVEMSEMLPLRLEAANMYASQLVTNFGDKGSMHRAMENYARGIRARETVALERYWTVS